MTTMAATVQASLTDRPISQRQASPHTVSAYRDTIRLSKLDFADTNATTVAALHHPNTRRQPDRNTRSADGQVATANDGGAGGSGGHLS